MAPCKRAAQCGQVIVEINQLKVLHWREIVGGAIFFLAFRALIAITILFLLLVDT